MEFELVVDVDNIRGTALDITIVDLNHYRCIRRRTPNFCLKFVQADFKAILIF